MSIKLVDLVRVDQASRFSTGVFRVRLGANTRGMYAQIPKVTLPKPCCVVTGYCITSFYYYSSYPVELQATIYRYKYDTRVHGTGTGYRYIPRIGSTVV